MTDHAPSSRQAGLPTRQRVLAAILSAVLLAWLVVGSALVPEPSGMGTHRQLGAPPCGWLVAFRKPCPTCGMTTAFSAACRGRVIEALRAQPFAAVLAVGVSAGFWACLHTAATGWGSAGVYAFLLRPRWIWAMLGLLALSWGMRLAAVTGEPW
ncbi:MAG: DUF2752 domain-containing protein [Phycisphaeraceae bacterium]|nr:DUF2752 domain-containing protein [Phycisphaerae bacterium]MBX3391409.1 DUF2752 domain-containing protein [Phycisphaeraceae bacterium]